MRLPSFDSPLQDQTTIVLAANNQNVVTIGNLAIAPTPLPTTLPANDPMPDYLAPLTTPLSPGTTYTVTWDWERTQANCPPQTNAEALGSFTTQ